MCARAGLNSIAKLAEKISKDGSKSKRVAKWVSIVIMFVLASILILSFVDVPAEKKKKVSMDSFTSMPAMPPSMPKSGTRYE
jgi:preprotein translocase subunit SecY